MPLLNPLESAYREATLRELERLGISPPASLLGFEIPASIRKRLYITETDKFLYGDEEREIWKKESQ